MKKSKIILIILVLLSLVTACAGKGEQVKEADYSTYFGSRNGCAVFYNADENTMEIYNSEMANTRFSPNSTFKIIAVLEGLRYGVIESENSHMHYNGGKYPFESWEKDLNLKEAFRESCVWYFRQVIDKVGQENMQKDIDKLGYGNRDISMWQGSGEAPTPDTNGFWLGSSLKISPVEMTRIIADIFEGKTDYDQSDIAILKNVMQSDKDGIYGKTGTGRDNTAWYAGFYEYGSSRTYFAVHIEGGNISTAGADAKEAAYGIISERTSQLDNKSQ